MNSYERVLKTLQLEEPDRVPLLEWSINPQVIDKLAPNLEVQEFMARELDVVTTFINLGPEEAEGENEERVIVDEWGIKRKYTGQDYAIPFQYPIEEKSDLASYRPPDPAENPRLANLEELVERYKGEKAICFTLETVFTYAWGLVGMENFFLHLKRDPRFAQQLLETSFDYHRELARRALEIGADIIMCGDDLAYKKGPMISQEDFERFLLSYYEQMIDLTHEQGARFVKHTDGQIDTLIPSFVEAGADAINPLEPAAGMDIGRVKENYGELICLIGNIDCGELLSRGSPEEVEKVVKETIEAAAPGGGYILSSSNEIHAAVRPENFRAMLQAAEEWGQY